MRIPRKSEHLHHAPVRCDANYLLSFAKIRPICAFRVKPCYKIKKMSSNLGKALRVIRRKLTRLSGENNHLPI